MHKKYAVMMIWKVFCLAAFVSVFITGVAAQEVTGEYRIRTVVIDAGHGGKDPGAIGKKGKEKDVVLAIALKLGSYIEERMPEIKVVYTRKTDTFPALYERAEIANNNKADLFISIHANGNPDASAYGTETLLLGYHRAGENFEVAKRENSVILYEDDYTTRYEGFDPSSPESYIMFSLMQERYFERSVTFAALVQDQFRDRARRKDRGVYRLGLLVLARTAMPGVLIETGFITNPDEEAYLMSSNGQDLIASAIFRAFRDYRNIVESKSSFATVATITDQALPSPSTENPAENATQQETVNSPVAEVRNENGQPVIREGEPDAAAKVEEELEEQEGNGIAGGQDVNDIQFKVQVTASSKAIPLNDDFFQGYGEVSEFHTDNLYKYAVGGSSKYDEIMAFSNQVKERFPDAFVIGVKDGKIIPLSQALKESQQNNLNN